MLLLTIGLKPEKNCEWKVQIRRVPGTSISEMRSYYDAKIQKCFQEKPI